MKIAESTPAKLLLGTAAASLTALGIVFVASSVSVPTPAVSAPEIRCAERVVVHQSPPPPAPRPEPTPPRTVASK